MEYLRLGCFLTGEFEFDFPVGDFEEAAEFTVFLAYRVLLLLLLLPLV